MANMAEIFGTLHYGMPHMKIVILAHRTPDIINITAAAMRSCHVPTLHSTVLELLYKIEPACS